MFRPPLMFLFWLGLFLAACSQQHLLPESALSPAELDRLNGRIARNDTSVLTIEPPAAATVLQQASRPIAPSSPELPRLLDQLEQTVRARHGMGIAAVQIGIPVQAVLLQRNDANGNRIYQPFLNPKIEHESQDSIGSWEHCLSIPWGYRYTHRPRTIRIRYLDPSGLSKTEFLHDAEAVVFQQEIDHLRGHLLNRDLTRAWFVPDSEMPGFVEPIDRLCSTAGRAECEALMRTRWMERGQTR